MAAGAASLPVMVAGMGRVNPSARFSFRASAVGARGAAECLADGVRAREPVGPAPLGTAPPAARYERSAFFRRRGDAVGHRALWTGRGPHGGQRLDEVLAGVGH